MNQPQPHPQQVTTDIVANGIVKGYFKLVLILLAIGIGIGVLWGVGMIVTESTHRVSSSDSQRSIDAFGKEQHAKPPHQLYEASIESSAIHSADLDDVSLYQDYNKSPDFEKANSRERSAADALQTALDKLAQAKADNLSADLIGKAQQRITAAEAAFDKAVADHNAGYLAKKSAEAQKAKDDLVRDLSGSGQSHGDKHKAPSRASAFGYAAGRPDWCDLEKSCIDAGGKTWPPLA